MRDNEFRISYAIGVGGVRTIVLIAHTDCGMARLAQRREQFIHGLTEAAGWDEGQAVRHFEVSARGKAQYHCNHFNVTYDDSRLPLDCNAHEGADIVTQRRVWKLYSKT